MKRASIALSVLVAALLLGLPGSASAHPLGNFTVNRYSRIDLAADRIGLRYVLDLAEIPAYQEIGAAIDRDRDGWVDDAERTAYLATKVAEIRRGLHLSVNGAPVDLRPVDQDLSFPPGQGNLATLRLVVDFAAPPAATGGEARIDYRDDNAPDRIGWREIVIRAGEGIALRGSTAAAADRSGELTAYPEDLLSSPLDQRSAQATFEVTGAPTGSIGASLHAVAADPGGARRSPIDRSVEGLTALIASPDLSPLVWLLALIAAVGLGALHALSPGHGKTVVAAYLVGSRGTARHALFLGLTVTITHTAGVFALGIVTLAASQYILPEQLYPWLSFISGAIVLAIGLTLFITRLRAYLTARSHPVHVAASPESDHTHSHPHLTSLRPALALAGAVIGPRQIQVFHGHSRETEEAGDHAHHHGHQHHDHPHQHQPTATRPGTGSLARVEGTPHFAAPTPPHPTLSPGEREDLTPRPSPSMERGEARRAISSLAPALGEGAGGRGPSSHSHLPPGVDGRPVTWRSLLALGVSGGLLPCPSALVVLLSAISLHRVGFGLLLIIAFSAGLAGVLTATGLLLVYAGRIFGRLPDRGGLVRLLPIGSALVVAALGGLIAAEALSRAGIWRS